MDVSGRKQQSTSSLHDRQTSRSWLSYSLWSSLKRRVVTTSIHSLRWRYTLPRPRMRCSRYSVVQMVKALYYFQRTVAKGGLARVVGEQGMASSLTVSRARLLPEYIRAQSSRSSVPATLNFLRPPSVRRCKATLLACAPTFCCIFSSSFSGSSDSVSANARTNRRPSK